MTVIADEKPLQQFFFNLNLSSPTQNSIVFHVQYSKSKTDKYKAIIVPAQAQGTCPCPMYVACS